MAVGDVTVMGPYPPGTSASELETAISGTISVAGSITSWIQDGQVWFAFLSNA